MWFKSKKQKVLENQSQVESVILDAAKKIMFKKDVEKGLQSKINSLQNENQELKIKINDLKLIIQRVKEALK